MRKIYNTLYNFMGTGLSFEDQSRVSKELGFAGMEIFEQFTDETMEILKKYDLETMEARVQYDENGDFKYIDNMQKAGIKYISGAEGYWDHETAMKAAEELNALGKKGQPYGFKADSHNHTGEFCFDEVDGCYCWETIAKNTDPDLVCFKLDIGWSTIAGVDSNYLMKKYPGRVELVHIKPATAIGNPDTMNNGKNMASRPRRAPGERPNMNDPAMKKMMEELNKKMLAYQGPMADYVRDLKELLDTAEACGAKSFIIERDGYYLEDKVEVIRRDLETVNAVWAKLA